MLETNNRGFLKLHEDEISRRGSHPQTPQAFQSQHTSTYINFGCGRCLKWRVKAERDDGNLKIGSLTFVNHCYLIVIIFGFFFLFAGTVLSVLAYGKSSAQTEVESSSRQEGRIAGPIFVLIGSTLVIVGISINVVGCKLNQEAKRQMTRFSLQPPHTPDTDYVGTFANIQDHYSRNVSNDSSRRDSLFGHMSDRRATLPTIAQAVPVGFFMDGALSGIFERNSWSHDKSEIRDEVTSSVTTSRDEEDDEEKQNERNNAATLSLRPSLPIPILASPGFLRTRGHLHSSIAPAPRPRSDEPFGTIGSIASLSGNGDIACFPVSSHTISTFSPCKESLEEEDESSGSTTGESNHHIQEHLPPINVNASPNLLAKTSSTTIIVE